MLASISLRFALSLSAHPSVSVYVFISCSAHSTERCSRCSWRCSLLIRSRTCSNNNQHHMTCSHTLHTNVVPHTMWWALYGNIHIKYSQNFSSTFSPSPQLPLIFLSPRGSVVVLLKHSPCCYLCLIHSIDLVEDLVVATLEFTEIYGAQCFSVYFISLSIRRI